MNATVIHPNLLHSVITADVRRRVAAPTADGTGLPGPSYTSEAWLALERERLFARSWMLAGFCRDIPGLGDVCPVEVAGMPVLLLRDDAGQVRAFHNVCRHRGAVMVDRPCTGRKILTCPYHGWAYGLDGAPRTLPHYHGAGQHLVAKPGDGMPGLVPVRHAVWHDLIFVDMSGKAPDFDEHWTPFAQRTAAYDFGALRYAKTLTFDVKGNWKLIYENFYDSYHVPTIHPRLEEFSPITLCTQTKAEGAWLIGTNPIAAPQEGRGVGMPYYPGLNDEARRTGWFFHLFPTLCFQLWPDQLAVFQLHALAPDRTIEHIHLYFMGEAATDPAHASGRQAVYDMWNELNTEDFRIVENIQVARRSPAFDGGKLSPFWDPPTQHFARLTIDAMTRE